MVCAKEDCGLEFGCMFPVLLVWAKGIPKKAHKPARVVIGLPLCIKCQKTTRAKDLITDKGWDQIEYSFIKVGRAKPDRETVRLDWVSPNSKEAKGMKT